MHVTHTFRIPDRKEEKGFHRLTSLIRVFKESFAISFGLPDFLC